MHRIVLLATLALLALGGTAAAQTQRQEIRSGPSPEIQAMWDERWAILELVAAARYDEAERRARALLAAVDGRTPEHQMLGPVLTALAFALRARGRNAEARPLLERNREVFARAPRPDQLGPRAFAASQLGRLRQAEGRAEEAVVLFREAVALRAPMLTGDYPGLAGTIINQGQDLMDAGQPAEAEAAMRRALVVVEQRFGANHTNTAGTLWAFVEMFLYAKPTGELRPMAERARAIAERHGVEAMIARMTLPIAYLLEREGRFAEAESELRRALPVLARGGDEQFQAIAQVRLAGLLAQRAATAEAERAAQQALPVIERHLGRDHALIGFALTAQGRAWRLAGRAAEAEPVLRRAIAIRQRAIANDPGLAVVRVEHGLALEQLGRMPEAIAALEPLASDTNDTVLRALASLYFRAGRGEQAEATARRAVAAGERQLGAEAPQNATTRALLGRVLVERGKAAEAEGHLRSAVAVQERALGAQHPDVALTWHALAQALEAQGKLEPALEAARKAARLAAERGAGDDEIGERLSRREVFTLLVSIAGRLAGRGDVAQQRALLDDAFRALQLAKEGATAAAVSRMAERAGANDPRLAELLRARSEAGDAVATAAAALRTAVARGGSGDAGALAAARGRRAELERRLAREFPAYARLFAGRALSIGDIRGALGPDEAVLDLLVLPQQLYAMVIRADGAWLVAGDPAAAREVPALVRRLRASLEPGRAETVEQLPAYDAAAAHRLFQAAVAPAMARLEGINHLFVVPDGALQSVPFALLLTAVPAGDARAAAWLLNRFATTTLPAASTLRALRAVARPTEAAEAFLGVGDPVLAGLPGEARGSARGLRGLRGRPPQLSRLFTRNGLADVRSLRELAPLPETADEVRALARALGAGGDALVLGRDATERRVRSMDLSRYRVLAFATHGLTAGEVPGFAEPGLVLTPPERASAEDDGVLGVSAIARLRLDADLVILSACNTAAADGSPGAEALSGLARAFLYAGARSLLVSHWPVVSQAAVSLTTGMVAAQQADPAIGRAEALRRSQRAFLAAAPSAAAAHPFMWAPFVLVGEGGRPIAVATLAPEEDEAP